MIIINIIILLVIILKINYYQLINQTFIIKYFPDLL